MYEQSLAYHQTKNVIRRYETQQSVLHLDITYLLDVSTKVFKVLIWLSLLCHYNRFHKEEPSAEAKCLFLGHLHLALE